MASVLVNVVVNVVAVLAVLAAILGPFITLSHRSLTVEVEIRPWTSPGLSFSTLDRFDCATYEPLLPQHHTELPRVTMVTEQRPPHA